MRIAVRVFQGLLGLHTLTGAVWKVSNPPSTVSSLAALPRTAWLGLGAVEVVAAIVLLIGTVHARTSRGAPFAATFVAAEMALFATLHLASGATEHHELGYWTVVALLALTLAWATRPRRS